MTVQEEIILPSSDGGAKRRLKAIMIGSSGNLVEYYDIYVYAAFSLYFAKSFFPGGDEIIQQLDSAVVFAVGFLARPFGGWFLGHVADRYGRRGALILSVSMMSLGSLLIAVMPTYASIGYAAPAILSLVRILQGLAVGGEYGASATYLSEVTTKETRGFWSGVFYTTIIGGQLLALMTLAVIQNFILTPEELRAWGWRIPFFLGAVLSVTVAILRTRLGETGAYKSGKEKGLQHGGVLKQLLMEHPIQVLQVIGMTAGGTAAFYTYAIYMQKFLKLVLKFPDKETTTILTCSLVFALILQPLYGWLSDRTGRKWMLVAFGLCGTIFTVPLMSALREVQSGIMAFTLIAAAWLISSCYSSIAAIVKAELFPAAVRVTGVALPYALTVSIFGGTSESIALSFKSMGHEQYFFYYLSGVMFLSFLAAVFMPDTKKKSTIEG